jgi:Amt family ammonium transporter
MLHQFLKQGAGVLSTIVYDGIATFIILKVVDVIIGLRVSEEQETEGLDLALHDERGYVLQ